MKINHIIKTTLLLGISTPLFAATIHCKKIPNTTSLQCIAQGKNAPKLFGITNMPYALCSKALCKIDKHNPKQANCACALYSEKDWKSLSISPTNYATSKPQWNSSHQLDTVQSNFSLANITPNSTAKLITCEFKKPMPWANCFGARCAVTGKHTASCKCPIYNNKTFAISGPGDVSKCKISSNQAWSGILVNDGNNNSTFVTSLYKKLYPSSQM